MSRMSKRKSAPYEGSPTLVNSKKVNLTKVEDCFWGTSSVKHTYLNSLLAHHIPSPDLGIEDDMSLWPEDVLRLTYGYYPREMRPVNEVMEHTEPPSRIHERATTDCLSSQALHLYNGDSRYRSEPSPCPPHLQSYTGRAPTQTTSLCYIFSGQGNTAQESKELNSFKFGFESQSCVRHQCSRRSHSPLPSLSSSISSSPPTSPPIQCSFGDALVTEDAAGRFNPRFPCYTLPRRTGSPSIRVSSSYQTLAQKENIPAHQSGTSDSMEMHSSHYDSTLSTDSKPLPPKTDHLSSFTETSFMDWDDATSRIAKIKRSFGDMRLSSNRQQATLKRRREAPKHLRISRPTPVVFDGVIDEAQAQSTTDEISKHGSSHTVSRPPPAISPCSPLDEAHHKVSRSLSPWATVELAKTDRFVKVKELWIKVVGKGDTL